MSSRLSNPHRSKVDGRRHEFNQIGSGSGLRIRRRQWFPLFQQTLSEILHGARYHHPGAGQIEALGDGSRKIEGLGNRHLAGRARKVKSTW